jgi:hypothetical protein
MKLKQMLENYKLKLKNLKVIIFESKFLLIILFLEKLVDERNKCHRIEKMMAASSIS